MFSSRKPYTAVTVTIERLTGETYSEDDLSGLPELIEVIDPQPGTGPREAARAIRKKLKYGNTHRQLRALTLLDGLIQNAGVHFQNTFADEPLLERLRVAGTSPLSDPAVRAKCRELFGSWVKYRGLAGMTAISRLHKELPYRKAAPSQEQSKVIKETENPFGEEEEEGKEEAGGGPGAEQRRPPEGSAAPSSKPAQVSPGGSNNGAGHGHQKNAPSGSGTADGGGGFFSSIREKKHHYQHQHQQHQQQKRKPRKPFHFDSEKDGIKATIADTSIATTNLMNILQSINRERERISENEQAVLLFETCKQLRRRVFSYIHLVEDEQWLGILLSANDQLVLALMTFEQLDRSIDADSDSEDEAAERTHRLRMAMINSKGKEVASGSNPTSPASAPHRTAAGPSNATKIRSSSSPQRPGPITESGPPPRPSTTTKPSFGSSLTLPRPRAPPNPARLPDQASSGRAPKQGDSDNSSESNTDSEDDGDTEDENDPFADRNAVPTPLIEKGEWT